MDAGIGGTSNTDKTDRRGGPGGSLGLRDTRRGCMFSRKRRSPLGDSTGMKGSCQVPR